MRISVVGGGRMGLPLACVFAKHGAMVTVADIDAVLVQQICSRYMPVRGAGPTRVDDRAAYGRTSDSDYGHRCSRRSVGSNRNHRAGAPDPRREIDFNVLRAASRAVGQGLQRGALVVYETTVSIGGTRRELIPVLEQCSGLVAGRDFSVGYSPERVKANLVLSRLQNTPKVVGGLDEESRRKVNHLYIDLPEGTRR